MWVGVQISVEKNCIFGKKSVGPKNVEEKTRIFWKKIVGGYQITPGTNFQHMFRKFLPDPPLVSTRFLIAPKYDQNSIFLAGNDLCDMKISVHAPNMS